MRAPRTRSYESIVSVLAALHRVHFRSVGLEGYGKVGNYYARNVLNLTKTSKQQGRCKRCGTRARAGMVAKLVRGASRAAEAVSADVPRLTDLDGLSARLLRYLPEDRLSIVHGDFKMDNFVSERGREGGRGGRAEGRAVEQTLGRVQGR